MDLEKDKERWQALDDTLKPGIETDNVIAACRKRTREFRVGLLLSDMLEIGVGLAMAWVWAFKFTRIFVHHKPLMYLGATAILFICSFLGGARLLRYRNARKPGLSVSNELERQLYAVNQRIWLLRNLIWWYLSPCAIAIFTVLIAISLDTKKENLAGVLRFEGSYLLCCALLFAGIYWLNRRAVQKSLIPLKTELERVIGDIKE